jgi:hypothetical protein
MAQQAGSGRPHVDVWAPKDTKKESCHFFNQKKNNLNKMTKQVASVLKASMCPEFHEKII